MRKDLKIATLRNHYRRCGRTNTFHWVRICTPTSSFCFHLCNTGFNSVTAASMYICRNWTTCRPRSVYIYAQGSLPQTHVASDAVSIPPPPLPPPPPFTFAPTTTDHVWASPDQKDYWFIQLVQSDHWTCDSSHYPLFSPYQPHTHIIVIYVRVHWNELFNSCQQSSSPSSVVVSP